MDMHEPAKPSEPRDERTAPKPSIDLVEKLRASGVDVSPMLTAPADLDVDMAGEGEHPHGPQKDQD